MAAVNKHHHGGFAKSCPGYTVKWRNGQSHYVPAARFPKLMKQNCGHTFNSAICTVCPYCGQR